MKPTFKRNNQKREFLDPKYHIIFQNMDINFNCYKLAIERKIIIENINYSIIKSPLFFDP